MLSNISERKLHAVRWVTFLAWALLIVSLFYDPVSAVLTHPGNDWSPLADSAIDLTRCIAVQSHCVALAPYAIGLRVFWGMVIPSAIFAVLVFGHEFWRRICPLYFFSQLPRALGLKPLLNIEHNQWLKNNHLYVQFVLFFMGITARILVINSVRSVAGVFFMVTLLSAAGVVALYGGRSWCHYICPFGMVQTVFTGPRGLLDSQAHIAEPFSLTQSTCRVVDSHGQAQSACVSCKSSCMDIDSEQSYWEQLYKPGRKLVQYGYLGLVVGYFCYYGLYAGSFEYYFSGVWSHESQSIAALLEPGFYWQGREIGIPKLVAAPLTLAAFAAASCWICTGLERFYRGYLKQQLARVGAKELSEELAEQSLHRAFSVCTFVAFNFFFVYGGRPEINKFPLAAQLGFQALVMMVSSLWLYRTWGRSRRRYQTEKLADKMRRQLQKLSINVTGLLGDRSLKSLSAEELNILAQTLPQVIVPKSKADSVKRFDEAELSLPKTIIKRNQPSARSHLSPLLKTKLRKR
ncbi:MAG: 4Fe-4S binding protein [Phormidesmis sp.]